MTKNELPVIRFHLIRFSGLLLCLLQIGCDAALEDAGVSQLPMHTGNTNDAGQDEYTSNRATNEGSFNKRNTNPDIAAEVAVQTAPATFLPGSLPEQQRRSRLLLIQQRDLESHAGNNNNYPGYVKSRAAYIDTLPVDGIAIHSALAYGFMNGTSLSYESLLQEWAPLKDVTFSRVSFNFAKINVRKPGDFFDDAPWKGAFPFCV